MSRLSLVVRGINNDVREHEILSRHLDRYEIPQRRCRQLSKNRLVYPMHEQHWPPFTLTQLPFNVWSSRLILYQYLQTPGLSDCHK